MEYDRNEPRHRTPVVPEAGPGRKPYFIALAAALALSLLCLGAWRRETKSAMEKAAPTVMDWMNRSSESTSLFFRERVGMARMLAQSVREADGRGAPASLIEEDVRAAFDDWMFSLWLFLEADPERGMSPVGVRCWRNSNGSVRCESGPEISEGMVFSGPSGETLRSVMEEEIDFSNLFGSSYGGDRVSINRTYLARFFVPIARGGKTAGWLACEFDMEAVPAMLKEIFPPDARAYLVDDNGSVAHDYFMDYVSLPPDDAEVFKKCKETTAAGGSEPLVVELPSGREYVACAPVDVGDGLPAWFLLSTYDMGVMLGQSAGWLIGAVMVWVIALLAMVIIYVVVRRVKRAQVATAAVALSPEKAAAFMRLEFRRVIYFALAALFCIPVIYFLRYRDKRFQEAKAAGDIGAAAGAISGMLPAVAIGVVIGCLAIWISVGA